jgi:hypothetical protein
MRGFCARFHPVHPEGTGETDLQRGRGKTGQLSQNHRDAQGGQDKKYLQRPTPLCHRANSLEKNEENPWQKSRSLPTWPSTALKSS